MSLSNLTPNIKKLTIRKMSFAAVPKGGGIQSAINFLCTPGRMSAMFRESHAWVLEAIRCVREAPEPNPWKTASNEEIAGEILRKAGQHKQDPSV